MVSSVWPEGWPMPNYDNPPTRGSPSLFIVTLVITAIVVALRLYSRHYLTRSVGLDDGLLLAGFIFSIGQTIFEYKALTTWGWNMHIWDVRPEKLEHIRLGAWLVEVFFVLGNACTKVSILLVYRKISSGSHSLWFIKLIWTAIAFTVAYSVGLVLELFLICRPLTSYWRSYNPAYTGTYRCGNELAPIVFSAAASVFSDVYSSVLPMLLTRKLNLSGRQRLSLYVLFSAGLLTAGIGIARMIFLIKVTTNYMPGPHTHDVTWYGWPTYALTDIEAHLAMICASAPALKALFKHLFPRPLSNLNASIRSDPSGIPSYRARYSRANKSINPSGSHFKASSPGQRSLTPERVWADAAATDRDVESLSLKSMDTDKPLTPHYTHITELQRKESRQWPG
ncbi:hypothetical protein A1O3_06956 [Capronia epimyces CBS 606.96]|uniref:Rhodopsin domain-containing protein n=1 Tax=Capronia epimyces CBS 606.96 TaxID=1182542 RepID=W9XJH6_9EURO|nr:uncharacterized protein A1O3_06956 [Capronia epimyces CBS 606.96]EXJ80672.1 hypothetical protein A1O3_06956 [Capronia epimyces CBS 606.96]